MARASDKTRAEPAAPADAAEPTYDVLVARLEQVVEALEAGALPLEASVEKFAEGIQLAKDASRKLDEAERRVEQLVKGADGEAVEVPLAVDRT